MWSGGPSAPCEVPGGARLSVARFTEGRMHARCGARVWWARLTRGAPGGRAGGGPTCSRTARRGPRARGKGTEGEADWAALTRSCRGGADVAPTWQPRGPGERRKKHRSSNQRRPSTVLHWSMARRFNHGGVHQSEDRRERRRANGSDSPEGPRRRRISTAATGGEQKGKTRRDDEGSIQRGGSIYGGRGIRFRR